MDAQRSEQRRLVLSNGTWSSAQQLLSTGSSALTAFALILVVPVDLYGTYSYALALASIGMTLMTGGLVGLAVKQLVNEPEHAGPVVAALLLIREGMALIAYVVIGLVSLTAGSPTSTAAVLLAGLAILARAADAPDLWFRARMESRRPASARMVATSLTLALRLLVIAVWPDLWVILALFVIESVMGSAFIFRLFRRHPEHPALRRPDLHEALVLLRRSVPLLLSGIANQVNLRADIVILGAMLGSGAVGIYSAAARISELAYFLPVVFMNATLPLLLATRREHGPESREYVGALQRSYTQAFWAGLAVAGLAGSAGVLLIHLLFPPEYAQASNVLVIHVLACPFVFMAAVYSKWIIAEGYLWASFARHTVGAIVNVGLNLALVPQYGMRGAAVATVCSYVTASYLMCFVGARSRRAGMQMTSAILFPATWTLLLIRRRLRATTT